MKKTIGFLFSLFLMLQSFAQTFNPYHQTLVNKVSKANIIQYLTDFENFGVKTYGSSEEDDALQWLVSKYQSWGYTDIETQETYAYGESSSNLIVTKTGTVYPDQYIIIDGHYDTAYGPGTNDNGSGTSILLELARVLANVKTEYSIKFIHFTGEEWGFIGSYAYVDDIVIPQNSDIKLVFNIDEVGGVAGANNNKIVCEKDMSEPYFNNNDSSIVTEQLANCIELYSNLGTVFDFAYGSDYVPFQEEGYVITGLYEYNESEYPHTPNDTMENLDTEYIFQIAKGSLGALTFFAKAYENLDTVEQNQRGYLIYPNPADKYINIPTQMIKSGEEIQLLNLSGQLIYQSTKKTETDLKVDTSYLPNGIYVIRIGQHSQKIIIQHKK